MGKTSVLHIISHLNPGGAVNGMLYQAARSAQTGAFEHKILTLSAPSEAGLERARQYGIEVSSFGAEEPAALMERADIVQFEWWNTPVLSDLMHRPLPPIRSLARVHGSGCNGPHIFTPNDAALFDYIVLANRNSLDAEGIAGLSQDRKRNSVKVVDPEADLSRLQGVALRQHFNFNVGFIGSLDASRLHSHFVTLCSAINIFEVRFILCGQGSAAAGIAERAQDMRIRERFILRGFVPDIRSEIETFDVLGCPLHQRSEARFALGLREAMFAGVPPVVFRGSGLDLLVENGRTGLVVSTDTEYVNAIEHLYFNPKDRLNLGLSAKKYAELEFTRDAGGAEFNEIYSILMGREKRLLRAVLEDGAASSLTAEVSGADRFIESLGSAAGPFLLSKNGKAEDELLTADIEIARSTLPMVLEGIEAYRLHFPNDPYLMMWTGLAALQLGLHANATMTFVQASNLGMRHWRILFYLQRAAELSGALEIANNAAAALAQVRPGFNPDKWSLGKS